MQLTEREEHVYSDGIRLGERRAKDRIARLEAEIERLRALIRFAASWPKLPGVLRKRLEKEEERNPMRVAAAVAKSLGVELDQDFVEELIAYCDEEVEGTP